ncbi:MAG TPA: carbamoyl-phosphate synthase domain-containing protein, partial [Candidatus Binatia bacterium]|nr:carbamoyl-phosphate synthase domain-containing protein [Candidatus Binatia bacterium]
DVESRHPFVEGFIVKEYWERQSNWRAQQSLGQYLKEQEHAVQRMGTDREDRPHHGGRQSSV